MQILGISTDAVESHRRFCASLDLPFPLLADVEGKASELYGILIKTPAGDLLSGRSVFLVDREGVVRHADARYELKPEDDHEALLKAVRSLPLRGEGAKEGGGSKARVEAPRIEALRFGSVRINGTEHSTDVVFEGGTVRARDKGPSRALKSRYGHTPLTLREDIPWQCEVLVVGTGTHGRLPVLDEIRDEAARRGVKLVLLETPQAVEYLKENYRPGMNAILHVTC